MDKKPKKKPPIDTRVRQKRKTGPKGGRPRVRTDRMNQGPIGRPLKYNEEFHCRIVYDQAALENTVEQTARALNVSIETLYAWKKQYPSFSEAWENGKVHHLNIARNSLGQRAKGMKVVEEQEGTDGRGNTFTKKITKELPPDVSACDIIIRRYDARQKGTGMDGSLADGLAKLHDIPTFEPQEVDEKE